MEHTNEFVQLAQATGEYMVLALAAFHNDKIVASFIQDPQKITSELSQIFKTFAEIAKVRGNFIENVFYDLAHKTIGDLFIFDFNLFKEIWSQKGEIAGRIFEALKSTDVDFPSSDSLIRYTKMLLTTEKEMETFTKKYGVRPMRIAGFLDGKQGEFDAESHVELEQRVHDKIKETAKRLNVNPEFLAAALFQEGFVRIMRRPELYNREYTVDSMIDMGMDSIYNDLPALISKGYLDVKIKANLKFLDVKKNETGDEFRDVSFKNPETVIDVFGAMLAQRRDLFLRDIKTFGFDAAKLTKEQAWAGIYLYYNAKNAKNALATVLKKDGIVAPVNIMSKPKSLNTNMDRNDIRYNYLRVVSTASYLGSEGLFQ